MHKTLSETENETEDENPSLEHHVSALSLRWTISQFPSFPGLSFLFYNDSHYYNSDTIGHHLYPIVSWNLVYSIFTTISR